MLIQHKPDAFEKLQALSSMATDDILSQAQPYSKFIAPASQPRYGRERQPVPGVYKAAMPNGKFINLFRTMFTDFCMMDCAYCPNSIHVPRKRFAFTVDEVSKLFIQYVERNMVDGMFLSSGIAGSPDKIMDRMLQVVEAIRHKYNYKGYIHLKVMPGTSKPLVEEAFHLGTRLSINIETPTQEMMKRLSSKKDFQTWILDPMGWIYKFIRDKYGEDCAVGQVTQFVVGAADETDWDIFQRIRQLYSEWALKRVYYQAFMPAWGTPLEEHPPTPPIRENRLYQIDWLLRVYKFREEELKLAFHKDGFLDYTVDPKAMVAAQTIEASSMDINRANREELLRVPGIGPTAAERIVKQRRYHSIDNWRDLNTMGVVQKRAEAFIRLPGERTSHGSQLVLDLSERPKSTPLMELGTVRNLGCAGCPVGCGGGSRCA